MTVKLLALALCATLALVVGLVAGIVAFANGARPAGAVLTGGAAAAIWMPIALSVAGALGGL
jgi:hypothetical protein